MNTKRKLVFLLSCSTLFAYSGFAVPALNEPLPDWIAEPSSTSLCRGHYVPMVEDTPPIQNFWELPIELSANETEFTLEGRSLLKGEVTLKQGNTFLHADKITLQHSPTTRSLEEIHAQGHIQYFTPELSIWGNSADYLHTQQHLRFDRVSYRWYDRQARGQAKSIDIDKSTNVRLVGANYTTCAPGQNSWQLSAREINLHPKTGRGVAKHIRLDMAKVPVFYFPYLDYPIDNQRHSGFLFPNYGSTSNSGTELAFPYYWNIAPNYDLTFTGRLLTERGLEGQSKFRYLLPNSEGSLRWHFLPHDRKYGDFQKANLLSPPEGMEFTDPRLKALIGTDNRQAINFRHSTQWDRRWQFNAIFDYVSDDNYFVDLGNDLNAASAIQLPQQISLAYYGDTWSHYFNIEEYQVLQPLSKDINYDIYRRQPQWVFQALYPHQWQNLTLGLNGEMVNFTHRPDITTGILPVTGQRFHVRPSISLPLRESWYFLTPRYQFDWLQYSVNLSDPERTPGVPHAPSRTIPLYDVDSGLVFVRDFKIKDNAYVQTLEPRLYYLYVPYRNQNLYPDFDSGIINFSYAQLFRDNRFSGRDRIADANQLSTSLMSRFLRGSSNQELLRASVGEVFYFKDRHVFLCDELGMQPNCFALEEATTESRHSTTIAQVELHAKKDLSGIVFWEWDSAKLETDQAAFTIHYQPSPNKIINLNYYWLKFDPQQTNYTTGQTGSLNQIDFSFLWPLKLNWELLSLYRYNFQQKQTVEILGGLEYNGCCLALQLVGSRYLQSNNFFYIQKYEKYANAFFAQIVFKGLSTLPFNNPDGNLKQRIPGYTPLSDRQHGLNSPGKRLFSTQEIPLY